MQRYRNNVFWILPDEDRFLALDMLHDSKVAKKHERGMLGMVLFDMTCQELLYKWVECSYDDLKLKLSLDG